MRNAEDGLRIDPARSVVTPVVEDVFDAAEEPDFLRVFRPDNLPRTAEDDPVVGCLNLMAVDEGLFKQAEFIVDAVTERGVILGRQRIQKTGGEPAQTAVAEAHVDLGFADLFEVLTKALQRRFRRAEQSGRQQVVAEKPAHQIFEREIVNAADVLFVVHRLRRNQALMNGVAHRKSRGDPPVPGRGRRGVAGQRRGEVTEDQ